MIDTAYGLVLLLNLTGLFHVVAVPFGSSGLVSLAMLALNLAYLIYRLPVTHRLLRQASFIEWGVLLVGWPVLVLGLMVLGGETGGGALRTAGLQLYLLSLLLGAAVFVAVRGWAPFRRVVLGAVAVTVVGVVLNWLNPAYFYRLGSSVASTAGKVDIATASWSQLEAFKRAAGFNLEPNLAALACNALMLALLARYHRTAIGVKLIIIALMLGLTAASGSRGGLFVNLILSGLVLWDAHEELRDSFRITRGLALAGGVALVVVVAVLWIGVLAIAGDRLEADGAEGLAWRLRFWSDLGSGHEGDLLEDRSVEARLEAQRIYLEFIGERPLLGHGPDGVRRMFEIGRTDKMSHNLYFEKAFRFGIPYMLLILAVFFRTWQRGRRWRRRLPENASVTALLVALLAAAGMVAGGVLESRAVIVVLGAVLGYQYLLRRNLVVADAPLAESLEPASATHPIRA